MNKKIARALTLKHQFTEPTLCTQILGVYLYVVRMSLIQSFIIQPIEGVTVTMSKMSLNQLDHK